MTDATPLRALLLTHEPELRAFLGRHARGLLQYEALDDLVHGVQARALAEEARFEYLGTEQAIGWLRTLARRHVADRADHYRAGKRRAARVLRLTWSDSAFGSPDATAGPATPRPGPATIAERRELVVLALRAVAALPPRDRDLVRWSSEGIPLAEQATRLGLGYDATQRAAHRALARLRQTMELAWRAARNTPT
jgi:DNA-directed RNA polymerase specialized sigma24 family protein